VGVPIPEEALLVVEVAATSLIYDREAKLPCTPGPVSPKRGSWT